MLCLALSLVQRQHSQLKTSPVDVSVLQDDLDSLTHLADGDKGVAWADQTRISTNDLQDVNVSSFSLTQKQLFDCFLEHSSPRVRGGIPREGQSPQLFPSSLSILTATTPRPPRTDMVDHRGEDSDRTLTPIHTSREGSKVLSAPPTPTPRTNTNTVTVRASHTISSHASPRGNADSAPGSGGSVTVTTDVCISSDVTGSEGDEGSEVSSSGVGSYSTAELSPQSDLEYEKEKKSLSAITSLPKSLRTPAFDVSKIKSPATPTPRSIYGHRPAGTAFVSTQGVERVQVGGAPQPYSMFQPFHPPTHRTVSSSHVATPPSSNPSHPSISSQHSISTDSGIGHVTNIPRSRGGQLLIPNRPLANGFMVRSNPSSSGIYSNTSHLGNSTSSTKLNAFEDNFVSPPKLMQSEGHVTKSAASHMSTGMKAPIGALKSQFQSLPSPFSPRVTATPNPYVKAPSHIPSHLPRPSPTARAPHVYQSITIPGPPIMGGVSAPLPLPGATNRSDQQIVNNPPAARGVARKITPLIRKISPPTRKVSQATPTGERGLPLHKCLSGSKSNLKDVDADMSSDGPRTLNSTFTVEVGVASPSSLPVGVAKSKDSVGGGSAPIAPPTTAKEDSGDKKPQTIGHGRGLFARARSRSPSKLPSYLKMTKSSESKKVSR